MANSNYFTPLDGDGNPILDESGNPITAVSPANTEPDKLPDRVNLDKSTETDQTSIQDQYATNLMAALGIDLGPRSWLAIGEARADAVETQSSESQQAISDILSGKKEKEISDHIDANVQKIGELITSLVAPQLPTATVIKKDVDIRIAQHERMLKSGEFATLPNPLTGKPYTAEEFGKMIDDEKKSAYIDAGVATDPLEVLGTIAAQLINIRDADKYAIIPEKLRQERFNITKDNYMKNIDFQNQKVIMRIQQLGRQTEWLQDAWKTEAGIRNQQLLNIYDNEEQFKRLRFQIDNQNWREAVTEGNDILNNIAKLPPEQIEAAYNRYNSMASFVNKHSNGDVTMKTYTPEEIKDISVKAWARERERVIGTILDWVWKFRNKWENVTPTDRKDIETTLRGYGNFLNPATGKFEPLTLNDIAFAANGFNRLSPATQIKIEANRLRQESLDIVDRHNREMEKFAGMNAGSNRIRADAYAKDVENDFSLGKAKIANGDGISFSDFKSLQSIRTSITDLVKKRSIVDNAVRTGTLSTLLHDSDGPGWKKGDAWSLKDAAEYLKISSNSIHGLSQLMLETYTNYALPLLKARAESVGQSFSEKEMMNPDKFSIFLQETGMDAHTANKYAKEIYDNIMKNYSTGNVAGAGVGAGGKTGGK